MHNWKGGMGEGGTGAGGGRGSQTLHVLKAEERNKEQHTYPKAADLHHLF